MLKIKRTYEQFCTHMGRNVIIEETVFENGEKEIACTEFECGDCTEQCKNKLCKNN